MQCSAILAVFVLSCLANNHPLGPVHRVSIHNHGHHIISGVFLSGEAGGDDHLDGHLLAPRETLVWATTAPCKEDVRVVYTDDRTSVTPNLDTCFHVLKMTY